MHIGNFKYIIYFEVTKVFTNTISEGNIVLVMAKIIDYLTEVSTGQNEIILIKSFQK